MLGRAVILRVGRITYQVLKSKTNATKDTIQISASRASVPSSTNVYAKRWYSNNSQQVIDKMPTVDYEYVKKVTTSKDVYIIDVREPEEIKEHGKIPNSVNIPLGTVATILRASEKEFKQKFKRDKPTDDTEIIFYCMIGKRSGMAQENALNLGYKNAKNYLGSWTDWATKSQ